MDRHNIDQDDIHQRERRIRRERTQEAERHLERESPELAPREMSQFEADAAIAAEMHEELFQDVIRASLNTLQWTGRDDGFDDDEIQEAISQSMNFDDPYDPGNRVEEEDNVVDEDRPGDADARFNVEPPRRCVSCGDRSIIPVVSCGHQYCADCLTGVLRNAMSDGTAFPPRCCREPIAIDQIRMHLEPEFAVEFDKKAIELSTANPVYCSDAACSTFIPPSVIQGGDTARCPSCPRETCTHCRAQAHGGNCPEDEGLQQVLRMAEGEGWRQCECGRVIELNFGCNHMTCQCRREFCYLCGLRWKTCRCAQWQEDRLIHRAAQVVDRRAGLLVPLPAPAPAQAPLFPVPALPIPLLHRLGRNILGAAYVAPAIPQPRPAAPVRRILAPVGRAERIQHAAQQLQENANCTHPIRWRGAHGPDSVCELCHRHKARIYSCRHCGLTACYPCRRNRL